MDDEMTYRLVLDEVTETYATFVTVGDSHASFVMPRRDWERKGRPGEIEVVV